MTLTSAEQDFMHRIAFNRPLPMADRKQDRVRQRLRKRGLVQCVMNPRRWVLTDEGAKALAKAMTS